MRAATNIQINPRPSAEAARASPAASRISSERGDRAPSGPAKRRPASPESGGRARDGAVAPKGQIAATVPRQSDLNPLLSRARPVATASVRNLLLIVLA